jgi:NAD(P)-dependent dehydrogenase (short-subunit alcohol dehydrogenase family)
MNQTLYDLSGRSAIITGASQGLGRAIAEQFVRAGASVLITARDGSLLRQAQDELRAIAKDGQSVLIEPGDVSDREHCKTVVQRAQRELPGLSILVNNAGVHGPKGAIEEVDWDQWVQAMEINLFGPIFLCKLIIPHFKQNQYGKIINLSGGGATAPFPRISAYAASKAALVRMTETLAEELRDWHIDVNGMAPGALNTRLLADVLEAGPEKVGQAVHDRAIKQQKEGGASPERAAALAAFLASSQSDGITGRLISAVWDDWQDLPAIKDKLAPTDIYTLRRIIPSDRGL